jgi:hypothetical protein
MREEFDRIRIIFISLRFSYFGLFVMEEMKKEGSKLFPNKSSKIVLGTLEEP